MTINVTHCSFSYSSRRIFRDLSIKFGPGATVLLGPNGAGKSTLLGLMANILVPSRGAVALGHLDPRRRSQRSEYRRRIGWIPQSATAVPGFTVREQVAYAGWLKGMSRHAAWDEAPSALKMVSLYDQQDRKPSELSGGQLQRMGIAQALVHDAEVILMDEPTAGLDPQQRERFYDIVQDLSEETHLIISSHDVNDISKLYSHVMVLNHGKVLFHDAPSKFLNVAGRNVSHQKRALRAFAHFIEQD